MSDPAAVRDDPSVRRAEAAGTIETLDPEHSLHVAWLSLQLYDQLRDALDLPAEGRDLLAAAALWHDAGQRWGRAEHHRGSFDAIMAQPLRGFTPEERLQIANIARYHRRAHPSLEHPGYRRLPRRLRPLVDQMAAILRLSEGLDAGHLQHVRRIDVVVGPQQITVTVTGATYPMLEAETAQERSGLFREVFQRKIDVVPRLERAVTHQG